MDRPGGMPPKRGLGKDIAENEAFLAKNKEKAGILITKFKK